MIDLFKSFARTLSGPPGGAFDITPADNTDLAFVTRRISVGTGGNLAVMTKDGQTVIYKNLPDGSEKVIRATRVLATGTTATDLVGEY